MTSAWVNSSWSCLDHVYLRGNGKCRKRFFIIVQYENKMSVILPSRLRIYKVSFPDNKQNVMRSVTRCHSWSVTKHLHPRYLRNLSAVFLDSKSLIGLHMSRGKKKASHSLAPPPPPSHKLCTYCQVHQVMRSFARHQKACKRIWQMDREARGVNRPMGTNLNKTLPVPLVNEMVNTPVSVIFCIFICAI